MSKFLRFPLVSVKILLGANLCLSGKSKAGIPAHAILGFSPSLGSVLQRTLTLVADHRVILDFLVTFAVAVSLKNIVAMAATKMVAILVTIFSTATVADSVTAGIASTVSAGTLSRGCSTGIVLFAGCYGTASRRSLLMADKRAFMGVVLGLVVSRLVIVPLQTAWRRALRPQQARL